MSFVGITIIALAWFAMLAGCAAIFIFAIGGAMTVHWALGFMAILAAPWLAAMMKVMEWGADLG